MPESNDSLAKEIIALRDHEQAKQATFRTLWQETADYVFPRDNQITRIQYPGTDKRRNIYDDTAIRDSQDMAAGLSATLIPSGQRFFGFRVRDKALEKDDEVRRYLSMATDDLHSEMFESNFMLQINETIRSLGVFGTGNIYSEFDAATGKLNYRDYDISLYQICENNLGIVDTIYLTMTLTARQAEQEFGEDNLAPKMKELLADAKKANEPYEFIHCVKPRKTRNPRLEDSANMPFESTYVDVKNAFIVGQGGFEEFPFAVPRWMKSSHEVYGRGQGTESLADIKMLQKMKQDFIECSNRWSKPPLEVVERYFDGTVNLTPGAVNWVGEKGAISAIAAAQGNFPITKDILEYQQELIHKAFFRDIFVQLADLSGDRRTTVEIYERLREGLRRLALPVARLQSELFTPLITRSFMLMIRNGKMEPPPPQLAGANFGVEYLGELSLALQSQKAKGFKAWAAFVGQVAALKPDVLDLVDWDDAIRRQGESEGVDREDIATPEQVAQIREARAQAQQAQQAMQMAEVAGKGYKNTSGAAEAGSPAGELMAAMGG